MRKSFISIFILALCMHQNGLSQKKGFYLLPQIGLLNGSSYVNASAGLSGGLAGKKWNYGIGAAFDYYKFRSVPLYVEVKRQFGNKQVKPFVYADAGWNIAFPLEDQRYHFSGGWWWETSSKSEFSNGFFAEGGAGLNLPNKKGKGIVLSFGYSTKTLSESWTDLVWDPVVLKQVSMPRSNKYTLNRIVLKVGFRVF